MQLYIYDHCPFCNKVRIAAGLLGLDLPTTILADDDLKTPIALVGKKVLPILVREDGTAMGESMDIVKYLNNLPTNTKKINETGDAVIDGLLEEFMPIALRLTFPITANMPFAEFETQSARDYYVATKQEKFGDLSKLAEQKPDFLVKTKDIFLKLDNYLADNHYNEKLKKGDFSVSDINLYAFLRMVTIVKGLEFLPNIENFMQIMQSNSKLELLKKFQI